MNSSKWIAGLTLLMVVIAGGIMLNMNDDSAEDNEAQKKDTSSLSDSAEMFIEYKEGGEFDEYKDGDRYGSKMTIDISGGVSIFERIYRNKDGQRTIEEVMITKGQLDDAALDSLCAKIENLGFYEFPQRLPNVSPIEADLKSPAKQVTISIRKKTDGEMKTVQAHLGADQKYYPQGFFELRGELQRLMKQFN